MDGLDLGPAESWHIRSMPRAVRQAIIDRAHAERVSVAELLTKLVMCDGSVPCDASPHAVDEIERLMALACRVAQASGRPLPRSISRLAYGYIRARLPAPAAAIAAPARPDPAC